MLPRKTGAVKGSRAPQPATCANPEAVDLAYNPVHNARIIKWYRRWDEKMRRQVIVLVGYSNGIGKNDRTSNGRRYDGDSINIRCDVLAEAERDGLQVIAIAVNYKTVGKIIIYTATPETIRTYGTREYLYGCWQYSLQRGYWSIDGQAPTNAAPAHTTPAHSQLSLVGE